MCLYVLEYLFFKLETLLEKIYTIVNMFDKLQPKGQFIAEVESNVSSHKPPFMWKVIIQATTKIATLKMILLVQLESS